MQRKNMIVIVFLILFSLFFVACSSQNSVELKDTLKEETTLKQKTHITFGDEIQFTTDEKWQKDLSDGPFDLQLIYDTTYMGVMVYHLSDFSENLNSADKLLNFHIDDIKSKRSNVEEVEPLSTTKKDGQNNISQIIYSGVKDETKFIYFFNAITFDDNPDIVAIVLFTTHPSDFEKQRLELNTILSSAQLIEP
ncbi:hypothetical protein [Streptococcus marimammalium]|uniref:hypothetical protein n=1 Tax=Streptococcus marimammalium TaxID=269666 RepID=UPI000375ED4F|nr:hypothetical protein [Streptococcus marimammalium]